MTTPSMPAIFLGHGNPMHAISTNSYTAAWSALGNAIRKPKAVLVISAHWYIAETAITSAVAPRTIHDFGGFPSELYHVKYPAPGDPKLAEQVRGLLRPLDVRLDSSRGFDHGAWAVLRHVFPKADIPVIQLSIDLRQTTEFHYELGTRLAPLRHEDILTLGSGNLVHNLHAFAWGERPATPYDWATRFEARIRGLLQAGGTGPILQYGTLGPDAVLSVPTPDHYLPFLYVLGLREANETISFPVEGIDGGSVSMLGIKIGG